MLATLSMGGMALSLAGRAPASFVQAASAPADPQSQQTPIPSLARLIDLNTAQAPELDLLPGIGPVLAQRIVEDRQANGPFASVQDLERVHGIGPRTVERIRSLVTVSQPR